MDLITHTFTLLVADITEDDLDAIYGATDGVANTAFGSHINDVGFDIDAPTLADAILTAISQMAEAGLEVLAVEPEEYVWASEIAERTERSRQSISQLVKGQRGPGDFPEPAFRDARDPLWRWREVEAWFATKEGLPVDSERSVVLGAINGALEARRNLRLYDDPNLRKTLADLVASSK